MRNALISLALFLTNSSPPSVDMVRQSLEAASERWFFWLLISSGVVAIGCILEVFETLTDLKRWLRLRKHLPVEEENPTSWIVPIGAIGLLLVIAGVIGEGVFEGFSSSAETALRAHDSQTLAQALRYAGDAKDSAVAAKAAAAGAVDDINEVSRKSAALSARLNSASEMMGKIEDDVRLQGPRFAILEKNKDEFIRALKPFAGTKITVAECETNGRLSGELIRSAVEVSFMLGRPPMFGRPPTGAGWNAMGDEWVCGIDSNFISVSSKASPNTLAAAKALSEELNRLHIHMEILTSEPQIIHRNRSDLLPIALSMRDEDNPERIFLVLSEHDLADVPFPSEPPVKGAEPPKL